MENEQMTTELHFQSRETERLLERNAQLLEQTAQLKRQLLIHQELEQELARRTHVYQKLIRKLHMKTKNVSTNPNASMEMSSQKSSKWDKERELELQRSVQEGRGHREQLERARREIEGLQSNF